MASYNRTGTHVSIKIHSWPWIPFILGWFLMLIMGGLHSEINNSIPAISYWLSVAIVAIVQIIVWFGYKIVKR